MRAGNHPYRKLKSSQLDLQTLEIELMQKHGSTGVLKLTPKNKEFLESSKEIKQQQQEQQGHAEFPVDFTLDLFLSDDEEDTFIEGQPKKNVSLLWMSLALLSHTAWGIYPVLARYLQTTCKLPSMSLLLTGNSAVSLITLLILIYRGKFFTILRMKMLPILIIVSVIRAATNLVAPKFTMAVYVQLVTLMTPFIVAMVNCFFLKDTLPPFTFPALFFCTVGSALMLLSSISPLRLLLTASDWFGIGLGLLSACFLALYMVFVKKAMTDNTVQGEELLFFLTSPIVVVSAILTFVFDEDWGPWFDMDATGWIAFVLISFGCLLLGNFLQVSSIRHLGAPMVSTLLAFRLVSSLLFSQIIMDEQFHHYFQFVGAFIVLVTITAFLLKQTKSK